MQRIVLVPSAGIFLVLGSNTINEPLLDVSVHLIRVMTALCRLEKFNLTILMSSLISLVFCSSKSFFYFDNMTLLIQTLSRVPSVPVLTRFDRTFAFYEHNLRLCTLAKSGMAKIFWD